MIECGASPSARDGSDDALGIVLRYRDYAFAQELVEAGALPGPQHVRCLLDAAPADLSVPALNLIRELVAAGALDGISVDELDGLDAGELARRLRRFCGAME